MKNCIFLSKDYKYRVEEYNYNVYVKIVTDGISVNG